MGIVLITIYGLALSFILLYSLVQVHLAYKYVRFQNKLKQRGGIEERKVLDEDHLPLVTVQLPIFNEMYVVERLIDAVGAFDYPRDRLEIQVLDDSTDETVDIIARKVAEWKEHGLDIHHIHRTNRQGFKAGALQEGLQVAKGEFIAIFDADFLPHPDFLRQTLAHFTDERVGVVQTRWQHINEDYSILTKMQAFALDAHFSVEQKGRNSSGYFINFNGTGGVWRRTTIDDAGGWESDTLTEDLDLSYRAQLKGWRFRFIEALESPSELPAVMSAIKSQQFRWTKGAAEVARKNLGKVLMARLPFGVKLHAFFHLMNSALFICIVLTALLSVPLVILSVDDPLMAEFFKYATVFMGSLLALIIFFWVSRTNRETSTGIMRFLKFLVTFPAFLAISMGLSLHNAIATIEGYIGKKSPFIRTPKFNIKDVQDNWRERSKYLVKKVSPLTVLEGIFALYFISGIVLGIVLGQYGMIPFHVMLTIGFSVVFYFSMRHSMFS